MKGRVTTLREAAIGTKGYVGAMRKTKNTAEIQAIAEVLLFLLAQH